MNQIRFHQETPGVVKGTNLTEINLATERQNGAPAVCMEYVRVTGLSEGTPEDSMCAIDSINTSTSVNSLVEIYDENENCILVTP